MTLVHKFANAACESDVAASLDASVFSALPSSLRRRKEVDVILHTNPLHQIGNAPSVHRRVYGWFEMKCVTRAAEIRDVFNDALLIKPLTPRTGRRYCVALIAPPPALRLGAFPHLLTASTVRWRPAVPLFQKNGTRPSWHVLTASHQPTPAYRGLQLTTIYAECVPTPEGDGVLAAWRVHTVN